MIDVTLVTYRDMDELEPSERPLLDALVRRGLQCAVIPWDRPTFDWATTRVAVIRSTWDYFLRVPEFSAWIDRVSERCQLLNPPATVRWNLQKTYLRELAKRGIATVPTLWLERGDDLERQVNDRGWSDVVVKPAISAGAHRTTRGAPDAILSHARELLAAGTIVMVQPYLPSLATVGETSLIWFDRQFSHAVRREAGMNKPMTLPRNDAVAPTPQQLAFAEQALQASGCDTVYARVDLVELPDASQAVLELELIEPSLFLRPESFERFADAIARRLRPS
jgi:glutathione synthase/RimK-type ligase-like ATP-grasp enzyme